MSGQYYDLAEVKPLIKDIDFQALLADKAFDADWLLKELMIGAQRPVIPPKANHTVQRVFYGCIYKWRHLIENYFCKLKESKFLLNTKRFKNNKQLYIKRFSFSGSFSNLFQA